MSYSLNGIKWGNTATGSSGGQVTWSFASVSIPGDFYTFDAAISNSVYQALIRTAFQAWEDVANIDFVETADSTSVDIRLGMDYIDGASNTVGEAGYSYSFAGEILFAEIRFDTSETFTSDAGYTGGSLVNFYSVAVHEIGHAIGMGHVNDITEIMNPYVSVVSLGDGDILGAQVLYGSNISTGVPAGYNPIYGDSGSNSLSGTNGSDFIVAYQGNDILFGYGGNDYIHGNQGDDFIEGGSGNDELRGGKGQDTVNGETGNDEIRGAFGNDILYGESGNDTFYGGQDNDTIFGGDGDDLIYGLKDADVLTGGNGADTFGFVLGNTGIVAGTIDTITDFVSGVDHIDMNNVAGTSSNFLDLGTAGSYAAALIQAQIYMGFGVVYIEVTVGSAHYLFADGTGDWYADQAIQINTDFNYWDII